MALPMREEVFRIVNRTAEEATADRRPPADLRNGPRGGDHPALEAAARAQLELRTGGLSDAEWATARRNLVEFGRLLRKWHQQARKDRPDAAAEVIAINETLPKAA